MSRPPRILSSTGLYHVIFRGINHLNIFEEKEDYQKILEIIAKLKEKEDMEIYAYCLMTNHVHIFLKETGVPAPDCIDLFSYKVYRDMPIQSYVTDEEFNRIINVIDRSTAAGKRDFAIIQLSASTGLRACDVIHLRLKDIDWRKGEINLIQKKTGRNVALPLVSDAANALQDYILNGRPTVDTDIIFLRIMPPFVPISDAASVGICLNVINAKRD